MRWPPVALVLALLPVTLASALLLGCDGDEGAGSDASTAPPGTATSADAPSSSPDGPSSSPDPPPSSPSARGLAPTDEQEMADLLRARLREAGLPAGSPRCSSVRRLSPSATRFSCRSPGLAATYRIDWEHYGTGAYVITALDGPERGREIARGTLTISE